MINPKIFPTIMIVLSMMSAISYAVNDISDWRHYGYWICGSLLTFCVTY